MIKQHLLHVTVPYSFVSGNPPSYDEVADNAARDALTPQDASMVKFPDGRHEVYSSSLAVWRPITVTVVGGSIIIEDHQAGHTYSKDDVVKVGGQKYIVTAATTATTPPSADWYAVDLNKRVP